MKILKLNLFALSMFISAAGFSQVTGQQNTATGQTGDMQQDNTFENYDINRDSNIDRDEFNQRNNQNYTQWDTNQDDIVDEREFYDYQFNRLDQDRDRNLSQQEWESGYDNVYGDYLDDRDFNQYDRDRNQMMSQDEFDRTMRDTYMYSDYDTNRDRGVDRDELNTGIYDRMDRNRDNLIDPNEYNTGSSFYTGTRNDPNRF